MYIYIYIYIYIEQIIGELSCVRCYRVGYGTGLDFSTCNSDSDKRAYISVDQRKIKKVIMIIDEWWEKLELKNSALKIELLHSILYYLS